MAAQTAKVAAKKVAPAYANEGWIPDPFGVPALELGLRLELEAELVDEFDGVPDEPPGLPT